MEELQQIVSYIEKVKAKNQALGDILAFNFNVSLNEYQALVDNKKLDVSEQIKLCSTILGIDLETLVKHIVGFNEPTDPQLEEYIKSDQTPEKFSDEEYQKFLEEMKGVTD